MPGGQRGELMATDVFGRCGPLCVACSASLPRGETSCVRFAHSVLLLPFGGDARRAEGGVDGYGSWGFRYVRPSLRRFAPRLSRGETELCSLRSPVLLLPFGGDARRAEGGVDGYGSWGFRNVRPSLRRFAPRLSRGERLSCVRFAHSFLFSRFRRCSVGV